MRVNRSGEHYDVSELSIKAMLEGDFARAYTDADNSTSTSTDTIKNIANAVARENLSVGPEEFCDILGEPLSRIVSAGGIGHDHGTSNDLEQTCRWR